MRAFLAIAVVILSAVVTFGQTNKGGISGTVTDANGAAIPGATVTITSLGTGQKVTIKTSESGAFTVQSLDPVAYSVLVEANGFKKAFVDQVKVDTAAVATTNVMLEAGAVAEQVLITGETAMVNTESATTSQTITSRQLQDVPLNNRSVLDLALTAPNVTGDAGSEDPEVTSGQPVPGFNLNLNGGRAGSTSILADGVNNTGVGIARAVMQQPELILADEPTSSLDPKTSVEIMELLVSIADKRAIPVIVNIHNVPLARRFAHHVIGMTGGRVVYDGGPQGLAEADLRRIYGGQDWMD